VEKRDVIVTPNISPGKINFVFSLITNKFE